MPSALTDLTNKAAAAGVVILWLASLVVVVWVYDAVRPAEHGEAAVPDTVEVERTLTKRDTVTNTVPRVVRKFDTVRTTDTVRIQVPTEYDLEGTITGSPVDIDGRDVTLTYWNPAEGRHYQNEYTVERPEWRVTAGADLLAARDLAVASADVTVGRRWGPVWVSVGPAAVASVTPDRGSAGVGVTVGVDATIWSW